MAQLIRVQPDTPDPMAIREAADVVRRGLVVGFPTDTLYGLAVDPRNPDAVRRLYALKGRRESSALTLIAGSLDQVRAAAELTLAAERLAARWWPGPLTLVMRARPGLASEALAGGTTVGIRVPAHAVAVALADATGFAVTATSANRSGQTAALTAETLALALPDVDAILDAGAVRGGAPSTLVDASSVHVTLLRDGAIPWGKVLESLQ